MLGNVPVTYWAAFMVFVVGMLALDLGVFHRKKHEIGVREALVWSAVWVALSLLFSAVVFLFWRDIRPESQIGNTEAGLAFLAGYLVEKALSVDNIFVFIMLFAYFKVPAELQHRALFWGIFGALVFRASFVALGAVVLQRFSWTMILFSAFLILTGIRMALKKRVRRSASDNRIIRFLQARLPVTKDFVGAKFFVREGGKLWVTPLFIALLAIEMTDIIFAADSIPAIFAITDEPFLVFTSNVFAILGLRSLYFAVAGLVETFRYLTAGISAVLIFVGGKMLYGYVEKDIAPSWPGFPMWLSLVVIFLLLTTSVVASLRAKKLDEEQRKAA